MPQPASIKVISTQKYNVRECRGSAPVPVLDQSRQFREDCRHRHFVCKKSRKWHLSLISAIALFATSGSVALTAIAQTAQPVKTPSKKSDVMLFENITLSPNFRPDPQVLRGISGGKDETQKHSGKAKTETGPCIGFVDSAPDHRLTMPQGFSYLNLKVMSSGDTILLVRGPGGSWCSDDESDRNPAIGGKWLPGSYEIWVGSYEKNASFPYLLEITETRPK
ncbi:hypothetical protein [Pseudanabaena sp. PCC 6802]|uniref:hypothetical protein n=1 Tax=Pseudanabaena sp. PCC 6802 TaxID=118173 RepID=UPI000348D2CA|nr:hypothetical protein [Pseudanabaena sp. PCC 6802]